MLESPKNNFRFLLLLKKCFLTRNNQRKQPTKTQSTQQRYNAQNSFHISEKKTTPKAPEARIYPVYILGAK